MKSTNSLTIVQLNDSHAEVERIDVCLSGHTQRDILVALLVVVNIKFSKK